MRTSSGAAMFKADITARIRGMQNDMELVEVTRGIPGYYTRRYRGGFLGVPGFFKNLAAVDGYDRDKAKGEARLEVLAPVIVEQEKAWRASRPHITSYDPMDTTPETSERCDLLHNTSDLGYRLDKIPAARKVARATRPLRMLFARPAATAENV